MRITISKENYLKAIAEAEADGEVVIAATLARWLGVSPPAVTMATRRLKRDGLLTVEPDGRLRLTPDGAAIADRLLRRHYLVERMLAEIFGLEWYKVHDEAEQMEHSVSADFERKLAEKLGVAARCPHGHLLGAESPEDRRRLGLAPLSECRPGSRAAVVSVYERDRRLLEHLDGLGIRPGAECEVRGHDGAAAVQLRIGGAEVPLEATAAEKVWVRPGGLL